MSDFTPSVAYLDRLPDELFLQILGFSMHDETEFYPEYCVHIFKESRRVRYPSRPGHQQQSHLKDWCIVNATSRNIRRLGREAFFSAKTIAMSYSLPQQLRNGTFSAFGTAADQQIALRCTRSINLVDMMMTCPSTFMQLPATLQAFPKLERGKLSFGFSIYDFDLKVLRWTRGVDDLWHVLPLLHDIGVARGVVLQMGLQDQVSPSDFSLFLARIVRPRLVLNANSTSKPETKRPAVLHVD
ncbi:hypothetical protein F4802DRAFT_290009 [Xylaria palmicola]|nr:hypothetical protein F4802DRAFT_290009 [Xylaria palmicola]